MVTRLTDDVWWVDLGGTNAFVVDDGALTLVDTGMPWHAGAVERALSRVGSPADVERVLITHFDIDHVGGLARLDLDATVYVGADDAPYLRGEQRPPWDNHKGWLQRATEPIRPVPELPVESVADGDTVGSFEAVHTPGHTPGHTVFVSEALSVGLLGDLVMGAGEYETPPWYFAYDGTRAAASLAEFADRAPDFEVGCHGHGTPVVGGAAERVRAAARAATAGDRG